jgi:hypothetical protein
LLHELQLRRYHADGFAAPVPVLTPAEAATYRAACDNLEAALGGKPRTIQVRQMHLHLRWAFELACHPRVLDAVESILGPDLFVWATELFAKHPHDPAVGIGWHRDAPYLGLSAGRQTTAWVALADSTPENGCMRVLPRTAERPDPAREGDKPTPAEEPHLADVVLRAGELSLHAGDVIHGSNPNVSESKRIGFVVRYLAPDARPCTGRPPLVRVRGSAAAEHWAIVDPPNETDPSAALARMRTAAAAHFDLVLGNLKQAKRATT